MSRDADPIRAQMRAARHTLGWSLSTAEVKTGILAVVTGSWERGDRSPTIAQLRRWVNAYGRELVVLEPDQRVVGTDQAGEEYLTYVVSYGVGGVIDCDGYDEAVDIAGHMPGARVGQRVIRRGAITFPGWTP